MLSIRFKVSSIFKNTLPFFLVLLFSFSVSAQKMSNRKMFKAAKTHFTKMNYAQTIDLLNTIDPNYIQKHPKTNYYLLRSLAEMEQVHKAQELLQSEKEIKNPRKMMAIAKVEADISQKISTYDSLVSEAKEYFDYRNMSEALFYMNEAIAIDSFYLPGYKLRAKLYFKYDFEKAIEDYNRIIESGTDDYEVYLKRGLSHYHRNRPLEALPDFTKSIAIYPTAEAYYFRAKAHCQTYTEDCHAATIKDLTAAIQLKPDYYSALRLRGDLYVSRGQHRDAIPDFTTILEDGPEDIHALLQRAECYARLQEDKKAEDDYERITKLNVNEPIAYFRKGYYVAKDNYFKPDLLKNAIPYYNQAIEMDSTVSFYFYYRAMAQKYLNNRSSAILDLDKAIRLEPANFDYYNERNTCHFLITTPYRIRKKDLEEGISNFEKYETDSLTKHFHIAKTYRLLFHFLKDESYLEKSIMHLDNAAKFDENDYKIYYEKGLVYKLEFINYAKAAENFRIAISLNYYHLSSHLHLGWCLYFNKEYEAAYEVFSETEVIFPFDRSVQEALATCQKKID